MPNMKIGGFIKTTLSDWDGKVACLIFTPGCNFSCPFCHNPELVKGNADSVDEKEVLEYIRENSDFLNGVVISGGEPTLQNGLYGFLKEIKKLGLGVKLDTNGSRPEILDDLIGAKMIDYVAMDVKTALDKEKYSNAAGIEVDLDKIAESIRIIKESGAEHEFRTTVYPPAVSVEDVIEIAKHLRGADCYCIQQFRPGVTMSAEAGKVQPYPVKTIREMYDGAKPFVKKVVTRGI
jgi:pyruvate formate lyase activating enzyme